MFGQCSHNVCMIMIQYISTFCELFRKIVLYIYFVLNVWHAMGESSEGVHTIFILCIKKIFLTYHTHRPIIYSYIFHIHNLAIITQHNEYHIWWQIFSFLTTRKKKYKLFVNNYNENVEYYIHIHTTQSYILIMFYEKL